MVSPRRSYDSDSDADRDSYIEDVPEKSMEITYWLFGLLQVIGKEIPYR